MPHKYDDAIISPFYQDTDIAIKKEDRVIMNCKRKGTVIDVLKEKTDSAKDFSCYDTGGLLLQMDDYGLTVEPFGFYGVVEKLEENDETPRRGKKAVCAGMKVIQGNSGISP